MLLLSWPEVVDPGLVGADCTRKQGHGSHIPDVQLCTSGGSVLRHLVLSLAGRPQARAPGASRPTQTHLLWAEPSGHSYYQTPIVEFTKQGDVNGQKHPDEENWVGTINAHCHGFTIGRRRGVAAAIQQDPVSGSFKHTGDLCRMLRIPTGFSSALVKHGGEVVANLLFSLRRLSGAGSLGGASPVWQVATMCVHREMTHAAETSNNQELSVVTWTKNQVFFVLVRPVLCTSQSHKGSGRPCYSRAYH